VTARGGSRRKELAAILAVKVGSARIIARTTRPAGRGLGNPRQSTNCLERSSVLPERGIPPGRSHEAFSVGGRLGPEQSTGPQKKKKKKKVRANQCLVGANRATGRKLVTTRES